MFNRRESRKQKDILNIEGCKNKSCVVFFAFYLPAGFVVVCSRLFPSWAPMFQ